MQRFGVIVLSLILFGSGMAYANYLGPTANDLEFHVSEIPSEIFLRDPSSLAPQAVFPSSASLLVNVRDMNRDSVNGIPVTFEAAPSCQGVAKVSPQRVVTHNGLAQASVQADNTTGVCRIAIRVDDVTKETMIVVANTPTIETPNTNIR